MFMRIVLGLILVYLMVFFAVSCDYISKNPSYDDVKYFNRIKWSFGPTGIIILILFLVALIYII